MIASRMLPLLVMTFCLAGCQTILPTRTAAQTENKIAANTCTVWRPISYSGKDTAQTQLEVRANNAAQKAYCKAR